MIVAATLPRADTEYPPEALAAKGPALIDVRVDPASYPAQIKALRG